MERYKAVRDRFEKRMLVGTNPKLYCLDRTAGGEYVSLFTEKAWKQYLYGWLDCEDFSQ